MSALERMIAHFDCSPYDGSDLIADEARWELAELRAEAAEAAHWRTITEQYITGDGKEYDFRRAAIEALTRHEA